jgi:predicted phage terminase large subunit-like protein
MAAKNPSRAEFELILRNDFYSFMLRCFQHLYPKTKFVPGWYLQVVAATLEACSRGDVRRQIINIPPRYGKSTAASIAFVAWHLGHNPEAQIICVSYAQDFAEKLARDCMSVMSSEWYQQIFPTRLSSERRSAREFVTTKHGFRLATSVGGVLTGRGADLIIIDDALKPNEALSESIRKSVNDWYDNSLYSRLNDKSRSGIVIIMQRVHQDDLVGHVLGQEEWNLLRLQAIAEQDEQFEIETTTGRRTFRRSAGELLHPEREPREVIDRIRQTLGEYNFAGQYQQEPAPAGGALVKAEWFKTYTDANLPESFEQVLQSWDTANKPTELADYSVCTTWGIKDKRLYLLHVMRRKVNYPDLKRLVRQQADMHRATIVLIEDKASGTQLIQELTNDGLRIVKAVKPEGDKVMRFNAQTATIENGFVYLPSTAPWLAEFVQEITTFPAAKYDDQADSTSQALGWLNSQPPEPGIIGFYRRECALSMRRKGDSIEKIAGFVKSTPEEVQRWFKEDEELKARMQAIINRRYIQHCEKCGKEIPQNTQYIEAGGDAYHEVCWRKLNFGQ